MYVVQARGLPKVEMVHFRKQNRLIKYDFAQPGFYFVTICTSDRKEYFGEIDQGNMILNNSGRVAQKVWERAPLLYKNVDIDEFVVMPNHIHGIVIIKPQEQAEGLHYSLSQIVGSYKNVVSKTLRAILNEFSWQPSFYDHVIRKDESLDKIREYICNNPLKWELDKNNPANLWM